MKKSYEYIIDHIPRDIPFDRRPGLPLAPEFITIHSTGNPNSSARNERAWLTNPTNDRTASWHICIDESEAVEAIPLDEVAWHAGDGSSGPGNRRSIALEICESGDRAKTLDNAAILTAKFLEARGWGVERLRRHYDWSGKACPRILMADNWAAWGNFKSQILKRLAGNKEYDLQKENGSASVPQKRNNPANAATKHPDSNPAEKEALGQPVNGLQNALEEFNGFPTNRSPQGSLGEGREGKSINGITEQPAGSPEAGVQAAPMQPSGNSPEAALPRIQRRVAGTLNGRPVEFEAYLIDNSIYVPLRHLAAALGLRVEWEEGKYHLRFPGIA